MAGGISGGAAGMAGGISGGAAGGAPALLRELDGGVACVLRCLVQPRSSRNAVLGLQGGELKLALTAPPVDGAANQALLLLLAQVLELPKNRLTLVGGMSSRHKQVRIAGLNAAAVRVKIGV